MTYIDLHVHSTSSDGTYTPSELVNYALKKGLSAIALTDHDTIGGLHEAFEAAAGKPLEIIAGIEFSTEYHGKDIHIVGLDFDYQSQDFRSRLVAFQNSRDLRNEKMIGLLQQHGIEITMQKMRAEYPDSVWTRAHFGRYLKEHGYVSEISDAFRLYLGDGCPCFLPREKVTPMQAVELINQAGGISVLAHPLLYHFKEEELTELIRELKSYGLKAIEAYYSAHRGFDESYVLRLARIHGLCISGGSDFHGSNKPSIDLGSGMGNLKIPHQVLENLRKCSQRKGRR